MQIKRKYAQGDFNPFIAMTHVFENCLSRGVGHVVLIAGYSDRFVNDTVKAYYHVLMSKGLTEMPPIIDREMVTHTGTRLRFVRFNDDTDSQMSFQTHCQQASIVVLCNKYSSAEMINVVRATNATKMMYDYSRNNQK